MHLLRRKLNKDEEYQQWIVTAKQAASSRKQMEMKWRRWYNIADDWLWGNAKMPDGYEPTQVNQLASILENVIPNISFRAGKVEIRAFSQEDMISAAIWEKAARYLVLKHDLTNQFQSSIYNALVLGDGLMKIGHSFLPLLAEPQWDAGLATERGAQPLSVYGMDWPLFEFLPDFTADRWGRQRFFIHQFDKHIDEITDNDLYDKVQRKKVKATRRTEELFYSGNTEKEDKKKDYVPLWEIHDLINAEVMIIADKAGADDYLLKDAEPFNMIPVERLSFFNRPMSVWGKGITQTIEKHLVSLSKIETMHMKHLGKTAMLKILISAADWPPEMRKQLLTSKDSVIPLTGDPAGAYDVMDYGAASKEFLYENAKAEKRATIRELAGAGRMQQGLHETGVGSATESALLQSNADVITKWRANKFSEFAANVIEKMLFIVSVTYEPARIAKMVGYPVEVIAPHLQPYDPSRYVLSYGQAAVADQQERREKFMLVMQLFGNTINPAIAMQMAADIFDLEYTDELLIPGTLLGGQTAQQSGGGQMATTGFRPEESQGQQGGEQ